jgi:hypothetical protein
MSRASLCLITLLLLATAPTAAAAQEDTTSVALRIFQYDTEKKSSTVAVVLNLIPPLGHGYAGNVKRGLIPAAVAYGGLIVAISVQGECVQVDIFGICARYENEDSAVYTAASIAMLVGYTWGMIDAYHTVRTHNRQLRERLKLAVLPAGSGGMQLRGDLSF